MGPERTNKTTRQGESSTSKLEATVKAKPRRNHPHKESAALPGVQKIKASLRQARRLLAKDKVAADVRVETERRIKALEADLEQAKISKTERTNAVRYHKVKFFERQKVLRKLNQLKKRLEAADDSLELQEAITELRVNLNYILHYPKTKKYISLFPPELREDSTSSETPTLRVNPDSEEVRTWIRKRMDAGEISVEPELHLDEKPNPLYRPTYESGVSKKRHIEATVDHEDVAEDDAFFGDDTDDDV